jgi:hypothetical protein
MGQLFLFIFAVTFEMILCGITQNIGPIKKMFKYHAEIDDSIMNQEVFVKLYHGLAGHELHPALFVVFRQALGLSSVEWSEPVEPNIP